MIIVLAVTNHLIGLGILYWGAIAICVDELRVCVPALSSSRQLLLQYGAMARTYMESRDGLKAREQKYSVREPHDAEMQT